MSSAFELVPEPERHWFLDSSICPCSRALVSPDAQEEMGAFLEKRSPFVATYD
jgi:hypothetical protein